MKKNIKAFIKEIVPIIVGILIAIGINNWNESRKDKKYINQIFSSINKELKETNADINDNIPLHKVLIDSLDFYKKNDTISILDVALKVDGIKIPSVKISSWKSISNSKIELMEYDMVSTLGNIEEQKELLKKKFENLMNFIYANLKETGIDEKEAFKLMMLDIISTERSIQEEIKDITAE